MRANSLLIGVVGLVVGFAAGFLVHRTISDGPRSASPSRQKTASSTSTPTRAAEAAGRSARDGSNAATTPAADAADAADPANTTAPYTPAELAAMKEEIGQLEERLLDEPEDLAMLRRLGNLYFEQEQWPRAIELYERFLVIVPKDGDVLTDLGACYREIGEFDHAIELFDQAFVAKPSRWQAMYNKALILGFDLGRVQEGSDLARLLLAQDPNNKDVQRLIEALAKRQNS